MSIFAPIKPSVGDYVTVFETEPGEPETPNPLPANYAEMVFSENIDSRHAPKYVLDQEKARWRVYSAPKTCMAIEDPPYEISDGSKWGLKAGQYAGSQVPSDTTFLRLEMDSALMGPSDRPVTVEQVEKNCRKPGSVRNLKLKKRRFVPLKWAQSYSALRYLKHVKQEFTTVLEDWHDGDPEGFRRYLRNRTFFVSTGAAMGVGTIIKPGYEVFRLRALLPAASGGDRPKAWHPNRDPVQDLQSMAHRRYFVAIVDVIDGYWLDYGEDQLHRGWDNKNGSVYAMFIIPGSDGPMKGCIHKDEVLFEDDDQFPFIRIFNPAIKYIGLCQSAVADRYRVADQLCRSLPRKGGLIPFMRDMVGQCPS